MIDLHCHILPGVDDGSQDLNQSIKIAKEAELAGFTTIVCTPHYMIPNYVSTRNENKIILYELQSKIKEEKININLVLSNEVYITENILELLDKDVISKIGESEYILVELPLFQEMKFADEVFFSLQNRNLKIILAHPERYTFVQKDPNVLAKFIDKGIILQCNYASIIGNYGKTAQKTVKKMLKANMVSVLASDNHKDNTIYASMDKIREELKNVISEEYYNALTLINPQKIITNENLEKPSYKKIKKFFI